MRTRQARIWWLAILPTFGGYLLLSVWFPLAPHHNQHTLPDIRTFTPSLAAGLAYGALILCLFGLYLGAFRLTLRLVQPPSPGIILAAAFLFSLPLLFTFPVNATDLYRYVIRGRISSLHGLNPFVVPPAALPDDPFLPLAGEWATYTSPYGPLWEVTAWGVTAVSRDNLWLGLLLFKGLATFLHVLSGFLVWHLAAGQNLHRRRALVLLWAWNPALLVTFVVNGHNDALMFVCFLLGVLVIRRGRLIAGTGLLLLAPLSKPIGFLALPLLFAGLLRQQRTADRARLILGTVLLAPVTTALAFLPFGSPLTLVQRLIEEASAGAGFSVTALVLLLALRADLVPSQSAVNLVARLLFGLAFISLVWGAWRGRALYKRTAAAFAAYLLHALNFRIWYAAWPFPWLLLDELERPGKRNLSQHTWAGIWFLLTSQLSVLIYGHLRVFALAGDHLPAHLIGVPFTFGLPIVLAYFGSGRAGQSDRHTRAGKETRS